MQKIYFIVLVLLMTTQVQAQTTQKVGHFNLNNFLVTLPEVKDVDSLLQQYQATLVDTIQQLDSKLKSDVENYKTQRNDMTAVQAQQKEQAFMQADKEIQMYSKKAEQMMAMKRQILLTPILSKIDTIIKAIGKEGNYSIIIDASMMNALLFATETDDITSLVGSRYEKR